MSAALLCDPFVWFADGLPPMDCATYRRVSPTPAMRGNARRRELLRQVRERTKVICGSMVTVDIYGARNGWFCNCGMCPF